jgi:RecG-like helicase
MRAVLSVLMGLAMVFALVANVRAEEKKEGKEVTLKGKITCAKCELKEAEKCATVIQVKKGEKADVYYFDTASHKKYHTDICKEGKTGTVKGTVSEQDGKKTIKVTQLKYDE